MASEARDHTYVSACIKYLLFSFNFFFWLVGTAMIAIGVWAMIEKGTFEISKVRSIYDFIFDMAIVFLVLGIIVSCISFAGFVGALRENILLLKIFYITLGILFLAQIIGAILVFVFSSDVRKKITGLLQDELIVRYRDDPDLQSVIDWFQETFLCCGVGDKGYKDWSQNPYFNCTSDNPSTERCGVPYSCCVKPKYSLVNYMCGYSTQELSFEEARKKIYIDGCVGKVLSLAEDNLYIIGGVALGVALPQLLGIFLARMLAGQIEDQRSLWSS